MSIDTVPRAPHSKVFTDIFPVTKNKKKRKNINRYNRCKNCLLLLKPALSNSKSIIKKRGGKGKSHRTHFGPCFAEHCELQSRRSFFSFDFPN